MPPTESDGLPLPRVAQVQWSDLFIQRTRHAFDIVRQNQKRLQFRREHFGPNGLLQTLERIFEPVLRLRRFTVDAARHTDQRSGQPIIELLLCDPDSFRQFETRKLETIFNQCNRCYEKRAHSRLILPESTAQCKILLSRRAEFE